MTQQQLDDAYTACNTLIDYLMEQPADNERAVQLCELNRLREEDVQ